MRKAWGFVVEALGVMRVSDKFEESGKDCSVGAVVFKKRRGGGGVGGGDQ